MSAEANQPSGGSSPLRSPTTFQQFTQTVSSEEEASEAEEESSQEESPLLKGEEYPEEDEYLEKETRLNGKEYLCEQETLKEKEDLQKEESPEGKDYLTEEESLERGECLEESLPHMVALVHHRAQEERITLRWSQRSHGSHPPLGVTGRKPPSCPGSTPNSDNHAPGHRANTAHRDT